MEHRTWHKGGIVSADTACASFELSYFICLGNWTVGSDPTLSSFFLWKPNESAASSGDRRMTRGYGIAQAEMALRPRIRDYVRDGGDVRTTRRPVLTAYH